MGEMADDGERKTERSIRKALLIIVTSTGCIFCSCDKQFHSAVFLTFTTFYHLSRSAVNENNRSIKNISWLLTNEKKTSGKGYF